MSCCHFVAVSSGGSLSLVLCPKRTKGALNFTSALVMLLRAWALESECPSSDLRSSVLSITGRETWERLLNSLNFLIGKLAIQPLTITKILPCV